MRRLIQFNTIKKKIMSGFLLVIFLFLGTGIYNYITLNQLNADIETITDEQLPRLLIDDEIALNMAERTSLLRGYVLYGDPAFKEEFEATIEESIQLEIDVLAMNDSQEVQELVDKKFTWGVATDEVFAAYDAGNVEKARDIMQNEVKPLEEEILAGFKKLSKEREAEITQVGEGLAANGDRALILEVFFILLFLVLGVIIANDCANRISRPAYIVMDRLQSLAAGDLSHDDLETKSTDEIGRLVLATNEMNRHMRGLLDEINRVSETVSRQSSELSASADEVKAGTEQVAITMEELAQGAETQANSASDLTVIMEDFNTKIEEVSNNGEQIQQNSGNVLEMTSNGSELMQSSQDQMSKIYGIVKNARENMQVLDQQAQEISKLIAVIRDIADQTNLLALNAAIEAARAGEHGSGFAVVADEVRKLAEQVALSVNDITGIVTNIQTESTVVADSLESGYKEVENGSAQIETTGKTFDEIRSFVTGMVDNIQTVSGNLSGIVSNSHQMSSSIADIASVSEEAAAGVEQTAASAEQSSTSMEEMAGRTSELSRLADELHELLGQFKL